MHQSTPSEDASNSLQAHINTLHALPLDATTQALHYLLPHLTPSISPNATRLVTHQTLSGAGDLDTLGRIYLQSADRCTREHATFKTRLHHIALDKLIEDLYVATERLLRDGLKDGSVTIPPLPAGEEAMCSCCRGDPDAVILSGFAEEEALYYWEDDYKAIWGEEKNCGGQYGGGETWLKASREQVERKAQEEGNSSKL
ncbi:hypothetical protein BDW59DRAFT_156702 [Aspergillus cavernicola]|uniref:Uncharacterized protein n=1 Tax=Aspergillus cavernicola TaxID=176166 RepID=A0ABR4J1N1_9EURO